MFSFAPKDSVSTSEMVKVYHITAESSDKKVLLEEVSASVLREFSPYCRAALESAAFNDDNGQANSITIVGADFKTCKNILEFMVKDSQDENPLLRAGNNPELLGLFQLHEAAELLEVESISKYAMNEAQLVLARTIHPANVYTVLRKYKTGKYIDMIKEGLALSLVTWYGDAYQGSKLVRYLEADYPELWAELDTMVDWTLWEQKSDKEKREQAERREESRKMQKEADRKAKQQIQDERKSGQPRAKRQPQQEQKQQVTTPGSVATPARRVVPAQGNTWSAVAASPSTAPPARTPDAVRQLQTHTATSTSIRRPQTNATQSAAPVGGTWASVASHGNAKTEVVPSQEPKDGKLVFSKKRKARDREVSN